MRKNKKEQPSIHLTGTNVVGPIHASNHANVAVNQSSGTTGDIDYEKLFQLLEERIKTRPEDPNVDKEEIRNVVDQIKGQAAQGEKANQNKLERWLRNLAGIAPDILDVILASLGGPLTGFTALLQKIAARVKAESANKG